jgi:dyslexia susceptibility 1 candidate gene 1 protein
VLVHATIKGFKLDAIDTFISDLYVKLNAHPIYLLHLDLRHPITVEKSTFRFEAPVMRLTLVKATVGLVWDTLCIDKKTPKHEIQARRSEALRRAELLYSTKLQTREQQKEVEKKRMFHEHWEIEKQQRRDIESKVASERTKERQALYEWEDHVGERRQSATIFTPADVCLAPPVRQADTVNVPIDFTPKAFSIPTRTRGDEEYYRRSRYKPVSIEDSPMFWKERGDKLYRARDWKASADCYSESIKRDGCFLTCVTNRAACYLHLHQYRKAVEDCDLAMTILCNTPASETTQDKYRYMLTKLHTRRGAAYAWDGQLSKALEDYRLAAAYRISSEDGHVVEDLHVLEDYMKRHGLAETLDPQDAAMSEAGRLYYSGNYAAACDIYKKLLEGNPFHVKAKSNLCATLLQQGALPEALQQAEEVIAFCHEVANALNQPGAVSASLADSDDEEECEDELVAKRNEAAKKICEKSAHVYVLLKAYVRAAAALCGLKKFREAYAMMERAVSITPYDDDLRDDANRVAEKLRFETIVRASSGSDGAHPPAAPPNVQQL